VILVSAAIKGGVGKTTTSVYLAAVAVDGDRSVTLVDADPQASAAEWVEEATDAPLQRLTVVEAPTERLLAKALDKVKPDDVVVVDTPPGHREMVVKAIDRATAVVIPTRVGGVETPTATVMLDIVPAGIPAGLVVCSARTYTRDYHEAIANWEDEEAPVWGSIPERVAIAQGPDGWLSSDGLDAYGEIWKTIQKAIKAG
jgi:chromosome partitioning protein